MATIPGTAEYDKVDVIRCHIQSSIQMIAIDCHPFSTHTIVMACKNIILDVAKSKNIFIEWDHSFWIKAEYQKQFVRLQRKAYNYFKHADQDTDLKYNGPDLNDLCHLNEVYTFLNIHGYSKISGRRERDFDDFCNLILIRYPQYFKLDFLETHPILKEQFQSLDRTKSNMVLTLRMLLFSTGLLPKIPPA
jgi:hypothetical protein